MNEIDKSRTLKFTIFESTQVALNSSFMPLMPASIDQSLFFVELAEEMELTFCEQIDNGCPVFLGLWDNVLKAEKKLAECLRCWEEERLLQERLVSNTDENDKDLTQVSFLIPPQSEVSCVVDSALMMPSHQQTETPLLEEASQLFIVPSNIDQTNSQILQCKITNVNGSNKNSPDEQNKAEPLNSRPETSKVKEIYVDIVSSSNSLPIRNKSSSQKLDVNTSASQNPLDKLCQLLCIDEDETLEKRLSDSEKRRKFEDNLPYKYFCDQCSFKTKRENHLLKHAKLHEKIKDIFSCDQCDFKTIRESVLRRHKMDHSATKLFCKYCPYRTDTKNLLVKHVQVKHGPNSRENIKCGYCDYVAFTRREIRKHYKLLHKTETVTKFWKCSKCPYKSKLRAHLTRHENDAHGSLRQFLCHYCGKRFKRNDTLTQHKVIHGEVNRTYTCQHCGKVCTSAVFLREHLATHTTERPFLCDVCGSSFKTRGATQRHKRNMHSTNLTVFPCTQCERTFKLRTELERHRKTHRLKSEASVVPAVVTGDNIQQEIPITIQVVYTGPVASNSEGDSIK